MKNNKIEKQTRGGIDSFESLSLRLSGMRLQRELEVLKTDGGAVVNEYEIHYANGGKQRVLLRSATTSGETILKLMNDCYLLSWDGFCGAHPRGVKDGTMFLLEACVNDRRRVYASGSQNFPKHFHVFEKGLYALLDGQTKA